MAIVIVGFTLMVFLAVQLESEGIDSDEVVVEYPSWSTSRTRTAHYNAIYPANMEGRARRLLADADAVHEKVRTILGADQGHPILLDATIVEDPVVERCFR